MSFSIKYEKIESLPRMAWCAKVSIKEESIKIEHGSWVECKREFFVEGSWLGDFSEGNIEKSEVLLGSGGKCCDNGFLFFPSTDPAERLQSLKVGENIFFSNSLSYLLKASLQCLDEKYSHYESDFFTLLKGQDRARKTVPLLNDKIINLHYNKIVFVNKLGDLDYLDRELPPKFTNYSQYKSYVQKVVKEIYLNSISEDRKIKYKLMGSLSTGYDSPASTYFAREIGCTEAINFVGARDGKSEDAVEIADALGLSLIKVDRGKYRECGEFPEAEFLATGNGGDEVVYGSLADFLTQRLFVKGDFGDGIWGMKNKIDESNRYGRSTTGGFGASASEFRLRVGYINLSVPSLTIQSQPELNRISLSEEMSCYRIGGGYDRPIPRRIAEEAGVKRTSFGMNKAAVTQPIWGKHTKNGALINASWNDYVLYEKKLAKISAISFLRSLINEFKARLFPLVRYGGLGWYLSKLPVDLVGKYCLDIPIPSSGTLSGRPTARIFHWAIDKTMDRYSATRLSVCNENQTGKGSDK